MDHIQKHQAEMRARISGSYNSIEKSETEDNDIEKGGEGSGKHIGTTKSGKPIYEPVGKVSDIHSNKKGAEYRKNTDHYTQEDHADAAAFHREASKKLQGAKTSAASDKSYKHQMTAQYHDSIRPNPSFKG